jgi:integrase/recombinase XerD
VVGSLVDMRSCVVVPWPSYVTREDAMTTVATNTTDLQLPDEAIAIDDAQLAAVAFLARYSGRTLDAYRHDLRGFFQWASDHDLAVLAATRPHIELYRNWMGDWGLAASTRRARSGRVLARSTGVPVADGRTAQGSRRFVHRCGRSDRTRRRSRGGGRSSLFTAEQYDREHAALAVLLGL